MSKTKPSRVEPSTEEDLLALRRVYAAHFERVRKEQHRRLRARPAWKVEARQA